MKARMLGPTKWKLCLFFSTLLVALVMMISLQFFEASAQVSSPLPLKKPLLTESLFLKGKAVYEKQCAVCHGLWGRGDGKAAYLLYPKPRNFAEDNFRLVSTSTMEATDEDLFKTISRGMAGSAMPSWDFLPEEERWGVVYYVRYLKNLAQAKKSGEISEEELERGLSWEDQKRLAEHKTDPETVVSVTEEPPVTPESLSRGRQLFVQACASCHGPMGKGDGRMVMKDTLGYPIRPRDLTAGIFKGSASSEDLYYRIAAGLPGSPMPGYKEALTDEQIWDLVHYIQTLPAKEKSPAVGLRHGTLTVRRVQGDLSADPQDRRWDEVEPVFIPLTPLWWREERVDGVWVRAVHNGERMAIQLEWEDATEDSSTVAPQSFSDGAALEFSDAPSPPIFTMGSKDSPVTLWHWKASWQKEVNSWEDIETKYPHTATDFYQAQTDYVFGSPFESRDFKTQQHDPLYLTGHGVGNPLSDPGRKQAAEEGRAAGIGSFTTMRPVSDQVDAIGSYQEGRWRVVFVRELEVTDPDRIAFRPGIPVSIAFAVWDGSQGDRNGQKMVSFWNEMIVES